jgi:NAD-dependent deacetylase
VAYAPEGAPIYLIDPENVSQSYRNVTHIKKGASEGMKELFNILVKQE